MPSPLSSSLVMWCKKVVSRLPGGKKEEQEQEEAKEQKGERRKRRRQARTVLGLPKSDKCQGLYPVATCVRAGNMGRIAAPALKAVNPLAGASRARRASSAVLLLGPHQSSFVPVPWELAHLWTSHSNSPQADSPKKRRPISSCDMVRPGSEWHGGLASSVC